VIAVLGRGEPVNQNHVLSVSFAIASVESTCTARMVYLANPQLFPLFSKQSGDI
jgi:hypothetical protein